jgi:hypothetical protein
MLMQARYRTRCDANLSVRRTAHDSASLKPQLRGAWGGLQAASGW